ncbi:hypothetical protein C8R44DRAFT_873146 [Mycena epipterygia]|nr:hypothetical protein C8R44DRAFT_873146 [Mycena epipterygia]
MTNGVGGSSTAPQNTNQPPPPSRKTHSSQGVITTLRGLPSAIRRKKNEEIKGRNAERQLKHAKHLEKPDTLSDASVDESFITVSSAEASPATRLEGIMSQLSPKSLRDLLRTLPLFGGKEKRAREDDTDNRKAAKRIREEIMLQPGMSLPVSFHSLLFDLCALDVYLPLSLFTSSHLELITSSSATLTTRKLNAPAPGLKQPLVLDTEAFEMKYLKETDLDRAQWIEASRNYISFIEEASGLDSSESAR